jgi:putative colanic acid biosynthesis glycosyltransferase
MPVYNAASTLEAAINSVRLQSDIKWELIIVDGGSTDGTVTLLQDLNEWPNISWLSEPDSGIYDAMNKGIDRANGEWLYFLGSDDKVMPQAFNLLNEKEVLSYKIVFGDVQFDNGYQMRSYLGERTWLQNTLHHQAAFYHRSIFDTFRYDVSLRLLADYELNLIAYKEKWPVLYTNQLVAQCDSGGASSNWSESLRETNIVRQRYIKSKWKQLILSSFLAAYYAQKLLRRKLYGHKI